MPLRVLQKIQQNPCGSFLLGATAEICTALVAGLVFLSLFSYILIAKGRENKIPPVDVDTCTCPCWDGLFKGGSLSSG